MNRGVCLKFHHLMRDAANNAENHIVVFSNIAKSELNTYNYSHFYDVNVCLLRWNVLFLRRIYFYIR